MSPPSPEPAARMDGELRVRLYIAGDAPNSTLAMQALRAALARCSGQYQVEVVDVLREPERGFADGVLLTPLLVRLAPLPERRLLGNLSDEKMLLGVLTLADRS